MIVLAAHPPARHLHLSIHTIVRSDMASARLSNSGDTAVFVPSMVGAGIVAAFKQLLRLHCLLQIHALPHFALPRASRSTRMGEISSLKYRHISTLHVIMEAGKKASLALLFINSPCHGPATECWRP
jgi:NADH:ubiquinone oxidoreductase subunit 2 (subunit N)